MARPDNSYKYDNRHNLDRELGRLDPVIDQCARWMGDLRDDSYRLLLVLVQPLAAFHEFFIGQLAPGVGQP